ncbi:MAG: hypothetical protein U9N45_07990, partial [Gemmatimonadota bacterium]|nr:hypothetical protein [Gemmatimonadota bacterium]
IDLELESADERPAMVFDDVRDLCVDGFSQHGSEPAGLQAFAVVLKDVTGALLKGCTPARSPGFLRLEGATDRVSVIGNDLSCVKSPFFFGEGVPGSALFHAANRVEK